MVTPKIKRGYSYDFSHKSKRDVHINLTRVPPELHRQFKQRCKREGLSMRFVILSWINNWVNDRRPDEDGTVPDVTPDTIGDTLASLQKQIDGVVAARQAMGKTQPLPQD